MSDGMANLYFEVLGDLSKLVSMIRNNQNLTPEQLRFDDWPDELGRFRLCGVDLGLNHTAPSLLAESLRDSSHIGNQIFKILRELHATIQDAASALSSHEMGVLEDLGSEAEQPKTHLEQSFKTTVIMIDCLFQLSALTRKPARHDFLIAQPVMEAPIAGGNVEQDLRDMFPKADQFLIERLAIGIAQSRRYLDYRKNIRSRVTPTASAITAGQTDQKWLPNPYSSGIAVMEDSSSELEISESDGEEPTLIWSPPPTPPVRGPANRRSYECPYCFMPIHVTNRHSWRQHFFHDIRPYMCTASSCASPYVKFTKRSEWILHMQTTHAEEWAGLHIDDLMNKTIQRTKVCCPLCEESSLCGESYQRHLGDHLMRLSSFITRIGQSPNFEPISDDQSETLSIERELEKATLLARTPDEAARMGQTIEKMITPSPGQSPSFIIPATATVQANEAEGVMTAEATARKPHSTVEEDLEDQYEKRDRLRLDKSSRDAGIQRWHRDLQPNEAFAVTGESGRSQHKVAMDIKKHQRGIGFEIEEQRRR